MCSFLLQISAPTLLPSQEAQSVGRSASPMSRNLSPEVYDKNGNLNEGMSDNSAVEEVDQSDVKGSCLDQPDDVMISGSYSNTKRQKHPADPTHNVEFPMLSDNAKGVGRGVIQDDDKVEMCKEKQLRKRKRTIMNDKQVMMIERALIDEPDMQRKAAALQSWADNLCFHGSEVTAAQLKNWLNNRKARLARAAAKDVRGPSGSTNGFQDKQGCKSDIPRMISLKDIVPAAQNNIDTQFILLDKGRTTLDGQNKVCLALVADEIAAVHFQFWGHECDAFQPGDIIHLSNGIFSYNRNNLCLRAGKKGKVEKVGEFTVAFVETPNMSEIRWVPDPSNSGKYVQESVISPHSRIFPLMI